MHDSLSAFMPVYQNPRAVFEALKSFRTHYPEAPVTVVSDGGDDFSKMCRAFHVEFVFAESRVIVSPIHQRTSGQSSLDGIYEYFGRLYNHCIATDTDWVFTLETDVRTIRRVRSFPATECAGPRLNPFSPALTDYLVRTYGNKTYGYGMSGGSVWKREAFISAYEGDRDLGPYLQYDERVGQYGDIALTLLFLVNGFEYTVWDEVSEIFHEVAPIIRDSAFDHAYKFWYGKEYDEHMLEQLGTSGAPSCAFLAADQLKEAQ